MTTETIYTWCNACGNQIEASAVTCPYCGAVRGQQGSRGSVTHIDGPGSSQGPFTPPPTKKNDNLQYYWIAFIVCGVLFLGGLTWFIISSVNNKREQERKLLAARTEMRSSRSSEVKANSDDSRSRSSSKSSDDSNENSKYAKKPLTQWFLLNSDSYGATFRGLDDMARVLNTRKFNTTINRQAGTLSAYRGGTTLEVYTDVDGNTYCVINFGSDREVDDFIESLIKSHWTYYSGLYSHKNGGVYARVSGRTVKLIEPNGGLPYNF